MENKYELVKELWALYQRKTEIENELRKYFDDVAQANAEFKEGDIVSVFYEGKYRGDGIVNKISHGINYSWHAYSVKKYSEKPEEFEKESKNIRYNIKAIKKDGTRSERNFEGRTSYSDKADRKYEHYITKKATE